MEKKTVPEKNIIAVIPAYNVEDTVVKVVNNAQEAVSKVIVVNDGSKDNTLKVLKNMDVTIVNHSSNQGLGCALRHGFKAALKEYPDIVITLDSDGQHDAHDIKRLIGIFIKDKADAVIGSRLIDKSQWANFPRQRLLGNILLTFLTNLSAGRKVSTDSQSGFRAISGLALKRFDLTTKKMAISSEIIYELARNKCKVSDVQIKATYDEEISNVRAINDISRILILLLRKRFTIKKRSPKISGDTPSHRYKSA